MKALCWKFFRTRVRLPPPPPFLNYMKRHQYTCLTHVFVRPFSSIGIGIPPALYQIAIPPVPQADSERNEYRHPMFFAHQADNITHPSGSPSTVKNTRISPNHSKNPRFALRGMPAMLSGETR